VAPVIWLGYLAAALVLAAGWRRWRRDDEQRRRSVSVFLVCALGASAMAGFTQRDLYPFAAWNLLPRRLGPTWNAFRLVAVDSAGREHVVDARAWEPVSGDELRAWLQFVFPGLDSAAQARSAGFLLGQAEAARAAAIAGKAVGRYRRVLGPVAAPLTVLHPTPWSDARAVPTTSFVALRIHRDRWGLERRRAAFGDVAVRLVYEMARE
jgi:hypothetical protein